MATRRNKVFAIPDMHLPWVDWKAIDKIYCHIKDQKPDVIIQLGDLYDRFSFSKFARTHDICTPEEEIQEARDGAVNFWNNIQKISKSSRKIQLTGNHEHRLIRQTLERFPEIYKIVKKADAEMSRFAGVKTIQDARDGIIIDDVLYIHGYLTQLGAHAKNLGMNVCHGHSHRGGVLQFNMMGKQLFELDCGYLADQSKVPLQYGPTKWVNWVKGYGIIDSLGPRFIPL